jgi:hypothetical protein
MLVLLYNCILDRDKSPVPSPGDQILPPYLKIMNVTDITDSTAVVEVEIEKDWGFPISGYGACWCLVDAKVEPSLTQGIRTSHFDQREKYFKTGLRHLLKDTDYYVRAYATNSSGTGYSSLVVFRTMKKNENKTVNTVIDIESNVYSIVTVGSQKWTKENLRTIHYRNGKRILNQKENWSKITYSAFRWPEDDSIKSGSGVFYNWYAVSDNDPFAPFGWHIATEADFRQLMLQPNYQQLVSLDKKELNFPEGLSNGWWCASDNTPNPFSIYFSGSSLLWGNNLYGKTTGFYIRCVKN